MKEPVLYRHSQAWPAPVIILLACWWIPVVLVPTVLGGGSPGEMLPRLGLSLALPVLVVTPIMVVFSRLTVTVTRAELHLAFGLGRPCRTFERARIASAEPHRIPWWYGFGIRRTPKGWMWNVRGLDTVLITHTDGAFLVGTDEPERLAATLSRR